MQALSGTYFILVAQSIFANRMLQTLEVTYPDIDPGRVISTGASEIQLVFQGRELAAVLDAYMVGIKDVFAFSLAASVVTVLVALAIPPRRLPDHGSEKKVDIDETTEKVPAV